MDARGWAIVLLLLMVVSVMLELLTPMMGGFTIAAVGAAVGSVMMGFKHSDSFGYMMLAANLVLFPISLWIGLKFMKSSPLMHRFEATSGSQASPDAPPLTHLIGKEGRTLTPLRPGGSALIGEARVDVIAQGKFVEANTPVKVIHVEGNRVVVEPIA